MTHFTLGCSVHKSILIAYDFITSCRILLSTFNCSHLLRTQTSVCLFTQVNSDPTTTPAGQANSLSLYQPLSFPHLLYMCNLRDSSAQVAYMLTTNTSRYEATIQCARCSMVLLKSVTK